MTDLFDRISALSPAKQQLLAVLRQKKEKSAAPPAVPASPRPAAAGPLTEPFSLVSPADRAKLPPDVEDAYPLTMVQLGMLYHMELDPDAPIPTYHNVNSFHIAIPLDLGALEQAAQLLVARHPALRTSFALTGYSEPLQLVHRSASLPIQFEDLRHLPEDERARRIEAFVLAEHRRLVDLSRPPIIRFHVHQRTDRRIQFTLTEPHAISDGWSTMSNLSELFATYLALLHGEPLPEEPPITSTFRDFVFLERQALQSQEARRFWERRLADWEMPRLPRWRMQGQGFERLDRKPTFTLPPDLVDGLERLARSAELPFKSLLLAAHLKVMALVAGRDDGVTGLTTHGRPEDVDGERVRGLFLNTLPVRVEMAGGTWMDLARRVFEEELELFPHRRYPLAALQQLRGGRGLFEVLFTYLHFHNVQRAVGPGRMHLAFDGHSDLSVTNFPLAVTFIRNPLAGSELTVTLETNDPGISPAQVEATYGCYLAALAAMANDPWTGHATAPLLSAEERHQLLAEWNDTAGERPGDVCIHELFERAAAAGPDAVAVVASDGAGGTLTYRDLDRRANQLAHHLASLGVGPGELVGIYLGRSLEMIPALLGVLKSGGAYVPVAGDWPEERIQWILARLGVRHLITQTDRLEVVGRLRRSLPELAEVVCLDDRDDRDEDGEAAERAATAGLRVWTRAHLDRVRADRPARRAGPEDLAYIIFTSGSTGHPKGVVVRHRPVVNLIAWVLDTFGFGPADRVLFITALTFDLSVFDVFGLLAAGGSIHVASGLDLAEPDRLVRLLREEPITFWDSAPAALQQLVPFFGADGAAPASRLRLVFLSGDWIPLTLPDHVRRSFPGARVVSLGGATEATVWSNWYPVREVDPRWASIPYGRPMRNARYHVLDPALHPSPIGSPGDLYIGGECLSSGYAQEPALTAERYLPDPWADEPGARLYRTGDRARRWPEGTIEFLGRLDHQVKIRGYRIELGEIEAVLARHEAVREAVVLAREDAPGQKRLVAYFIPRREPAPAAADLRKLVLRQLPEYMVPVAFVPLPSFPVTPNGKLDRAALPAPELDRSLVGTELVAPRNPLERALADLWAELLGVEAVGVHDNFFALGGHSLLAIQLVTRLRDSLGAELPLRCLFENPTVAELASLVAARRSEGAAALETLPVLVPAPEHLHEPFPLTDLQQAYWLGRGTDFALGGVSAHTYQELELPGLDVERLEAAWRRLIARHPMLRAVVLPDGRQRVLESVPPFRAEVVDLRGHDRERAEAEVAAVRRRMAGQGPDPGRWPLFEVVVTLLDEQRCRLHVSLSLLICDAVSVNVLIRELPVLYDDPEAPLPPLAISFRDYVLALHASEGSEEFARSLAYWRERLPTLPPAPALPVLAGAALPLPARFVRRAWSLEAEAWRRAKALAARAGVTPSALVLAAYAEVLGTWSRSRRFTINILFFNRLPLHPQVDRIVGNFSSTVLLEVDATRAEPLERRARTIQERLWQDLEHSRVSGVRVLRELSRLHGASAQPVMPVVFTSDLELSAGDPDTPAGVGIDLAWGALQTPQVWLDHQVSERGGRLLVSWDVVEDLFPPGLVQEMFDAYCRLLALLSDEETWGSEPPSLVPAEHLRRIAAANATEAALPGAEAGLLHASFAEQARLRPEAPAVLAADRTLTYGELDRLANRIGRGLRELGARPNALVALVLDKGWQQAAGALGVLRSGAAYLPVDPHVPAERLAVMLEDGGVSLALTLRRFAESLPWPPGVRPLALDSGLFDDVDDRPLAPAQGPEDLAYVIFTSGSTGRPKGVAIEHRAALNTVLDVNRRFGVGPGDRALALSALSFDLSAYDLFGLLAAGGAVVLPEPEALREPARWADLMAVHGVSLWNSVPALMEMLVDHLEGRGQPLPASLRLVLLSGDWIPVKLPDRIRALSGRARTVSLGGATEASIWSILHPVAGVDPRWTSIPYGRPMANQRFHVLDERLEHRPFWVPGELYIGGAGLARGYWGDEEKTRASFLADPRTGERLYRTGDLGRWLPGGDIELLGREDLQVKIQGYRIELGEIEAALSQHPAVRACAVAAPGERQGSRRLVAYMVPRAGEDLDPADLRRFLETKLPQYMVPQAFVALDALPLTPNGKLDRRALPSPGEAGAAGAERVPPRDETERRLAAIWEELLGANAVGVRDSFFELGGHSLLAVRLMARIASEFGRELPISTLFEAPTIEALAGLLGRSEAAWTPLVEIQPGTGSERPFFCVHPVGGSVLCYRELARALGEEQPFYGLQSPPPDGSNTPLRIEEMASAYVEAMRSVQPEGPYRLGGWSMGGAIAFEMARQLARRGEGIELLALIDASAPGAAGGPAEVDDATLTSWFLGDLRGLLGEGAEVAEEDLHGLALFQRNYRALLEYVPQAYPGRVLLLNSRESGDDRVSPWRGVASGGVEVRRVPGDHYTMVRPPHVEVLAAELRSSLDGEHQVHSSVLGSFVCAPAALPVACAGRMGLVQDPNAPRFELTPELEAHHAALSPAQVTFLRFVERHPECLYESSFPSLREYDEFMPNEMQPWPLFLDGRKIEELARASVAVCDLVKAIPRRVFENDPARLAEYYGLSLENAALIAAAIEKTELPAAIARGDFILSPRGFQCCEFNIAGNIGGGELAAWADHYLRVPVLRRFLDESGFRVSVRDAQRLIFSHVLDRREGRPLPAGGRLNLAVVFDQPLPPVWIEYVQREYRSVLGERGLEGGLVVCGDNDLREVNGALYHGDLPIHVVIDASSGVVGRAVFRALLAGQVQAYNGPASRILSDKLNLALLSELETSELFTAEERAVIRAHVPWTRRVAEEFVTYRDERVYLPDLLTSERERLVIKLGASMQGADVHAGRFTPPDRWEDLVRTALAQGTWIVQEFQESVRYLFQSPEGGCGLHDLVWGVFVFGRKYGGGFLRVMPAGREGVINIARGARTGMIFEVE